MSDDNQKAAHDIDAYIDENLRRVFAALEQEELPDRFKQLLEKLHAQDARPSKDGPE